MMQTQNIDPQEVSKFESMASRWWDKNSEFKPLHDLNPLRLTYIVQHSGGLHGKKVLDVGCGGGILSESLALADAQVTAIDMGKANLDIARLHLLESGVTVDYQHISAEALAAQKPACYDVVTCMEMLEHVPDPAAIIQACARLLVPGGKVFFSTLNRNLKSYALAILGAEYLLGLLPKGTHEYQKFIRPSEMDAMLRASGLSLLDISGVDYQPFTGHCQTSTDVSVNYMLCAQKDSLTE